MTFARAMKAFTELLAYPQKGYTESVAANARSLSEMYPDAASLFVPLCRLVESERVESMQETYTRTFDLNPLTTLDLGWQLFGEDYNRGAFLVKVRALLRKHGIPETGELPDHISHVLPLLAALPQEEAEDFAQACVLPALIKIQKVLPTENPYHGVLRALRYVLESRFGAYEEDACCVATAQLS
jgi:nitrate reductase delta subunit